MSMMESEATKIIEGHIHFLGGNWKPHPDFDVIEALKEAIYALSKVQQYRAIGTVSEFRELKEENTELHCEMQAIGATMDLLEKEIRAKAIEEFAEALREKCLESPYKEVWLHTILKIAKEMKGE